LNAGVGYLIYGLAVNPTTHRIYAANGDSNTVDVIDADNDTLLTTIPLSYTPYAVAVNPATNQIYVTNAGSQIVTIIDASTNNVGPTVPVSEFPIESSILLLAALALSAYELRIRKSSRGSR
jgi:YVTN family beta-propeller protein